VLGKKDECSGNSIFTIQTLLSNVQIKPTSFQEINDLAQIKTFVLQSEDIPQTNSCVICIEQLKVGDIVSIFTCNHQFHKICIDKWLVEQPLCPICKLNILTKNETNDSKVEESTV